MPSPEDSQLEVFLRVRPLAAKEHSIGATQIAYKVDSKMVVLMDPTDNLNDVLRQNRSREKTYLFDCVFGAESTQIELYESTTKKLLNRILQGYNSTVFAYGATGAGKTYTMLGTDSKPGIMARTMKDLFSFVDNDAQDNNFDVRMSYLEIYNEKIRDLLVPSSKELELRESSSGEIKVAGLSDIKTQSDEELLSLLMEGNERRTQEPTAANATSSRSHAILQVTVTGRGRLRGVRDKTQVGKLFLIDLAGSERASITKNVGKRMQEGAHINRSLLALANVINGLAEKTPKYVNYRDSKLTRLLKDSLGGNSKTIMIANISPASVHFEESRNTLIYADRAKNIITKNHRNSTDVNHHVSQYQSIISELRKEISRLKEKIDEDAVTPRGKTAISRSPSEITFSQSRRSSLAPASANTTKTLSPKPNKNTRVIESKAAENRELFYEIKAQLVENYETQKQLRYALMNINEEAFTLAASLSSMKAAVRGWDLQKKNRKDPKTIINMKRDIEVLEDDLQSIEEQKRDLEENLTSERCDEKKLERDLNKVASNTERKQIFSLLSKLRELEAEKAAFQSDALLLSRRLERNNTSLRKVEEFNTFADKLITGQQQALIGGSAAPEDNIYQDYRNLRYQTKYQMLPLDEKARDLGEKSWNREILEKEFLESHDNGFSDTLTGDDLRDLKSRSRQNSEADIKKLPKITMNGLRQKSIDDQAIDYGKLDQRLQNIKVKAHQRRNSKGSSASVDSRSTVSTRTTHSEDSLPEIGGVSRKNSVKNSKISVRPRSSTASNLPPIPQQRRNKQ